MPLRGKVVITCAVTGGIHTPTMSPYLPVTPDEIAKDAIAAAEAGAAILHLHARDPKDGAGWMILGLLESQRGQDAAAIKALGKAEAARPDDPLPPRCEVYAYPHSGPAKAAADTVSVSRSGQTTPLQVLLLQAQPAWKRCLDLAGAATALVLLSPLLLLIALAVRLTSAGPVLFRQRRAGLGGSPFWMYKFRTMVANAERMQHQLPMAVIDALRKPGRASRIKRRRLRVFVEIREVVVR